MKNIAFLWAILAVSIGLAQDKPSMAGSWKLDITQSDFGSEPAPKSMAGTIQKETPQMLSYRVHGVDDKGKAFWYSWSGPEDGSKHPTLVNGKPSRSDVFYERPGRCTSPAHRGCRRLYGRRPHFAVAGRQHSDDRGYLKIEGRQGEQR
jgi:hypothetical protein